MELGWKKGKDADGNPTYTLDTNEGVATITKMSDVSKSIGPKHEGLSPRVSGTAPVSRR